MTLSNIKVEQISESHEIIEDYGEILTRNEMIDIFRSYFRDVEYEDGCMYGEYHHKRYCIYFKNVSYLGTPHPVHKKRIQIGGSFKTIYSENASLGIQTMLVGIYKYKSTILFVDFDISKYVTRKAHNSSAHVYTNDLKNGLLLGTFQKEDANGNIVTVFNTENIERYLRSKIVKDIDLRFDFISVLDHFFSSLPKEWNGKECYQEMYDADFSNALQPEWPGFYLEYRLSTYLKENSAAKRKIKYSQNKKKGDIDLDLFFLQIGCYGDLKAHSNDSTGIQGNDYDTIMSVLETSSIYYVVCNHDTEKDRFHNNEVTILWNTLLKKDDLMSYADKMKHSVKLTSYQVLEINKYNKQYLKIFHQGHNSNGQPRAPKISIKSADIGNFLIYQKIF